MTDAQSYAVRLTIDYKENLDRLTTLLRLIWAIPILIILGLVSHSATSRTVDAAGNVVETGGGGIAGGLFLATLLMIVFRQKYPRWWFDFGVELARFSMRVGSYLFVMSDTYPSTDETQNVHLEVDYPDVSTLNRWLPLVKWLLAIPHYIVLVVLFVLAIIATIVAWVAILITGSYPKAIFDFVVGVFRWGMRVWGYAFMLVTDEYPPFSLN